jgi:ABC-type transporter Mla MlaB component
VKLPNLLKRSVPAPDALPSYVASVEDVRGTRVVHLTGPVGKTMGADVKAANEAWHKSGDVFDRPVVLDFAATSGCDFSTVSFLVDALQRRLASGSSVAIVNAPEELVAELQIARVDGLFGVYGSIDEALAALADRTGG